MKIYTTLSGLLLAVLVPVQAAAYFTPEEVLLSTDFYLPPTAREAQARAEGQTVASEERRNYEQSQLEYYAPPPSVYDTASNLDNELHAAAAAEGSLSGLSLEDLLSDEDLALLNAVRLLDNTDKRLLNRVQQNQYEMQYYGSRLHGGAPPLAPTGAGGILAAITMLGAVLWTVYSVKKVEGRTKTIRS